jgi:hypothetical protein
MYGFYMIPKSFDCKIGNIFNFSGTTLKPEDRKTERKMNYEDITLAIIIVKTIIVIYYIIMTDNCQ